MTDRVERGPMQLLVVLVVLRVLLPLVLLDPSWELHRDELLYFAMGDHLAWRMQFPPFIAVVARAAVALFGDSVWAARVPAALGGGALTAVPLLLVRRLGGGRFALWCAWIALLAAPVFVRPSVLFQPVIFDQLWTALAVSALALSAREEEPRWWLLVGAALGLGLLTKASAVMYGAVVLGVTLVHPRLRVQLSTRWPWLAASLAIVTGLPSLIGQVHFGWPFLAQLAVLERSQFQHTSVFGTLTGQLLMLGGAIVVVGAGFVAAAARRGTQGATIAPAPGSAPGRAGQAPDDGFTAAAQVAALFALGLLATILLRGGKDYYAAPGYPVLVGVGATWIGMRAATRARAAVVVFTTAAGLAILPMGVPMLGPDSMVRYAAALGVGTRTNSGGSLPLPQDYADMLGWRTEAEAVARVYASLSPEDQAVTTLAGGNYGQTGAIAFYRRRFGFTYPVSSAGDFHAWGPGERSGEVLICVASPDALEDLQALYADVQVVARLVDPRRVNEEREVHIFLGRHPRRPLAEVWPSIGPEWD